MIVLFGASSDIGQRLCRKLENVGLVVRKVSRRLPDGFSADLQTSEGVDEALRDADQVISCAHARYTSTILRFCRPGMQIVVMGSTWRFSKVPNAAADEVRAAERVFLASDKRGVMLHSAMIYGGSQERNIQRLVVALQRFPILPVPGGGRQMVRPIYIDDVVECIFQSVRRTWDAPAAFAVAGPPLTWREMAAACAKAKGLKRSFAAVPISPAIALLELFSRAGFQNTKSGYLTSL